MDIFKYGELELEHLKSRDKKLGAAIDRIGMLEREVNPDPFSALIMSIVSQQISSKAADTIWNRLCEKLQELSPESIENIGINDIQQCGMSMRKAGYIKGLAAAVTCGQLEMSRFSEMPDDEIIKQLTALSGIGLWTAEMFLIFSLGRPDVVSWGDLAIQRGMMNLYGLKTLTKDQFNRYRKRYSPYGSVASLYLWALS